MAGLEVLSNIINNVPNQFLVKMVDTWNREAPVLSRILKAQGSSSAIFYTMDDGTGQLAGLIGEGDDIVSANEDAVDPRTEIVLQRAEYRKTFAISMHELRVVRSLNPSITSDGVVNRLMRAWIEGQAVLARFLERKITYGTGTGLSIATGASVNDFVGLLTALNPATLSYGGQLKSSSLGLQPNVVNVAGTLAKVHFSKLFAEINSATGGIVPDFIMANPITCATAIQPIADADVRQVAALGENAPYKIGPMEFPTSQKPVMSVNGIPVFQNSAWASTTNDNFGAPPVNLDGYIVAGRWEDMEFNYLPDRVWGDAVAENPDSLVSGYAGLFDQLGIPVLNYARAKTGSSVKFAMEGEAGFLLKGLNRFGLLYGATTS